MRTWRCPECGREEATDNHNTAMLCMYCCEIPIEIKSRRKEENGGR
tara:strand:- start:1367 stop:1504 length:138 start_codon:yes stop_codon:yes gene_type:complete